MASKFIFITGGVVSSLGKGLTSGSIAMLLERCGFKVAIQKIDPYINVDPGTMSPFQHGEVYVTEDGVETDLDLGHYERFSDCVVNRNSNFTSGRVYYNVIKKERRGDYLGKTVQVVPHITDEIKHLIRKAARGADILISELGGTVGDIEGLPFLEAIRQLRLEAGEGCALNIHLTLIPYLRTSNELKTKPTQHSVGKLREIGIQPDIIICRTSVPLTDEVRKKISLFCNVKPEAVVEEQDVSYSIYEVPIDLHKQNLDGLILKTLRLRPRKNPEFEDWMCILDTIRNPMDECTIALVGKYVQIVDSYKSIHEALAHGGIANKVKVNIKYIDSEKVEQEGVGFLQEGIDGILIPGGFGARGIEGKIAATKFAREHKIPFFGICLGMQVATIEFARNVLGFKGAHSTEFAPDTPYPVIDIIETQKTVRKKGATMRLGAYPCKIKEDSISSRAYKTNEILERHRHRYEFNNRFLEAFERAGMKIVGIYEKENLVEIIELRDHPWFVGVQFHPEFKSKPLSPHPLFASFIRAAIDYKYRLISQKRQVQVQ